MKQSRRRRNNFNVIGNFKPEQTRIKSVRVGVFHPSSTAVMHEMFFIFTFCLGFNYDEVPNFSKHSETILIQGLFSGFFRVQATAISMAAAASSFSTSPHIDGSIIHNTLFPSSIPSSTHSTSSISDEPH
ncbi:hypothetical protein IC582_004371 [Cucumis melo]